MWSNFAQKAAPPPPPPPPQRQLEPPPPPSVVDPHNNSDVDNDDHNNSNSDAWSDDDILEDELLDDLLDDVAVYDSSKDTTPIGGSNAPDTIGSCVGEDGGGGIGSPGMGGGWGSTTLTSFASRQQQHEPLDLSSPPTAMAAAPASSSSSAPAPASSAPMVNDMSTTDNNTEPSENQSADGWDDDDLFNDSTFETPKKETEAFVPASNAPNLLGRAAEHFGAALLASVEKEEEEEEEEEDDEEFSQERGGFGGGFVMKGLSRFIEAATTPQRDESEEDSEEDYGGDDDDGWGDDDDLDFQDEDENETIDETLDEGTMDSPVDVIPLVEDVDADNAGANNSDVAKMEDDIPEEDNESPSPIIDNAAAIDSSQMIAKEVVEEQEPELQDEEPVVDASGDGWDDEGGWDDDDIDISFNTPRPPRRHSNVTPNNVIVDSVDSGKSSSGVPASIKDFVAMTESNLDEEFNSAGMWKTPPPSKNSGLVKTSSEKWGDDTVSVASSGVGKFERANNVVVSGVETNLTADTFNGYGGNKGLTGKTNSDNDKDDNGGENVLSKSLTEFVDNLDAELNDAIFDNMEQEAVNETSVVEPTSESMAAADVAPSYDYDESKDDSPEPVALRSTSGAESPLHASLPHQESWYLNAMEGGKGGVVYGEEEAIEKAVEKAAMSNSMPLPPVLLQGRIHPPEDGDVNDTSCILPANSASNIVQSPTVGMPLSEMPSSANSSSPSPEMASSENGEVVDATIIQPCNNEGGDAALKHSELQCKYLELIMPLPNNKNENELLDRPGFGMKTLPDGTTVLVNYEKLLLNEATKRILLQRSVEAYEKTMEKLQSKTDTRHYNHQAALQHGAEEIGETIENDFNTKLLSAHDEIATLKELVQRLQDEKENLLDETQLFEAELTATANDKEYLESEVEMLQQENNAVLQRSMEQSFLEESDIVVAEKTRFVDQVEMLQRELEEVREEKEMLLGECNALNEKVQGFGNSDATEAKNALSAKTESALRSTVESLQQELLEKSDQIEQLTGQLLGAEDLTRSKASENDQLRSTIGTLQQELLEKDAEIEQFSCQLEETMLANDQANMKASESGLLKSTIESLHQELLEKGDEIEQLVGELQDTTSGAKQASKKASDELDLLQNDFSKLKSTLAMAQEENEALRAVQRDYEVEISELKAMLESMDINDSGEVNKLTAEIASLTYELDAKSTECEESASELRALQIKLGNMEARLVEHDSVAPPEDRHNSGNQSNNNDAEQSPTDDNCEPNKQLENLREACSLLENQNSALETSLAEGVNTIQSLKMEIQSLNAQVAESSTVLHEELNHARKLFDDKVVECAESAAALTLLQADFDHVKARLAEYSSVSTEDNNDHPSETEQSLRAEMILLNKELVDSRGACRSLGAHNSDLEKSLEESAGVIQRLETEIQNLNGKVTEASNLRDELTRARRSLDEKVQECRDMANSCEELKTELLNTSSDREVVIVKGRETAEEARTQISRLESQIADHLKDHHATIENVEEQLSNTLQENSRLSAWCEEYRIKFEDAEKECTNIKHSYTEEVSKLQSEYLELSAALQTAQSALEAKQLEASDDASTIEHLQNTIDTMKQEMVSLAHRHQELLQENADIALSLETRTKASKEKTDILQQECAELREYIETSHEASMTAEQTVVDLKDQLEALRYKLKEEAEATQSMKVKANTAEQQTNLMKLECAKFRSNLDASQKASVEAKETATNLKAQLKALEDTNAKLEDQLFEASFENPEVERLATENASLRKERDGLKEESQGLSQRINELTSQANSRVGNNSVSPDGEFTSVDRETLVARINVLEEELKAEKLNELRDELTSLHEERQQLDLDNEELLVQLGLIQQEKIENQTECEIEVETLREQVSNLQDECKRLQVVLDDRRSNTSLSGDEDHARMLQEENLSLHQSISQLGGENESLKCQISDLTQKIEGLELENSQVIKNLRQKLGMLELKLADKEEEVESAKKEMESALDVKDVEISKLTTDFSSRENELKESAKKEMRSALDMKDVEFSKLTLDFSSRENELKESAKKEMQSALDVKDAEISKLTIDSSSRVNELKDMSNKLDAAHDEMGCFNSQIESLQSQYIDKYNQTHNAAEEGKGYEDDDEISLQDLLAEAVLDSDDYLRSQIVVLAQALERSELQRADALERIFTERKTNEESLRQLGESVKRFYSTVRCSDA